MCTRVCYTPRMGEIADMMLDGTMCQVCGVWLEQDPVGYPVTCGGCIGEGLAPEETPANKPKDPKTVACPDPFCERKFRSRHAAANHWVDKHE